MPCLVVPYNSSIASYTAVHFLDSNYLYHMCEQEYSSSSSIMDLFRGGGVFRECREFFLCLVVCFPPFAITVALQ